MTNGDISDAIVAQDLRGPSIDAKRDSKEIALGHAAQLVAEHAREGSLASGEEVPTFEDLKTLRRVPAKIPLTLFSIAFIELCERFSYYGTTIVCMF
jgi:POT family proton-dependent oligopeptide transporter